MTGKNPGNIIGRSSLGILAQIGGVNLGKVPGSIPDEIQEKFQGKFTIESLEKFQENICNSRGGIYDGIDDTTKGVFENLHLAVKFV